MPMFFRSDEFRKLCIFLSSAFPEHLRMELAFTIRQTHSDHTILFPFFPLLNKQTNPNSHTHTHTHVRRHKRLATECEPNTIAAAVAVSLPCRLSRVYGKKKDGSQLLRANRKNLQFCVTRWIKGQVQKVNNSLCFFLWREVIATDAEKEWG